MGVYKYYRLTLSGAVRIAEVELIYDPATDQRGAPRMVGDADLGAVEFQPAVVDTVADEDNVVPGTGLSLREAIAEPFASTISFDEDLSGQTIVLGSQLDIDSYVTITGSGLERSVTLNGNPGSHRLILVRNDQVFEIEDLTLINGGSIQRGGAIYSLGGSVVTARRCTFRGNSAVEGGAIYSFSNPLTVEQCTFSGNDGTFGAAIQNRNALILDQSTIAGNNSGNGGGIWKNGAITMRNSIVANNTGNASYADLRVVNSTFTWEGENIVRKIDNPGTGTPIDADPRLASLGDYGGPTDTMALLENSPALDAGDSTLAAAFVSDQRGSLRIVGAGVDIGAFESAAFAFSIVDTDDRDGDGMNDEWEVYYGFDPDDPSDGLLDADGDGQSNAAEEKARTNPLSALSQLRITQVDHMADTPMAGETTFAVDWDSVPEVVYSIWGSTDGVSWTPIEGSNIIAVEFETTAMIVQPSSSRFLARVEVGAAPGIAPPVYAEFSNPLTAASSWLPESIVNTGDGTPATSWTDLTGIHHLFANSTPTFVDNATPTGAAAVDFSGNDALVGSSGAGEYALNGATAFTLVTAFSPDGNGESSTGPNHFQKSRVVSASGSGMNDWAMSYADDSIWFGLGDAVVGDATMLVPAGTAMIGEWWIAVCTWNADDGSGNPSVSAWLFDQDGNEVASLPPTDPNTIAGTNGGYSAPIADTGFAIGGNSSNPNNRNFDGKIATVQLFGISVGRSTARQLASEIASDYTSDAPPE